MTPTARATPHRPATGRRAAAGLTISAVLAAALLAAACRPRQAPPTGSELPAPAPAATTSRRAESPPLLRPGQELERPVSGDETHAYLLELPAGALLRVQVQQIGADVTLTLSSPQGERISEVDRPFLDGDDEEVLLLGEPAGTYRLEVHAWENTAGEYTAGSYRLRVGELRVAGEEGRRRVEIERVFARAQAEAARASGESGAARQRLSRQTVEDFTAAAAGFAALGDTPRRAQTICDLGYHQYEMGHTDAAVESLRGAARLFAQVDEAEHSGWALFWTARTLKAAGREAEQEAALRQAVRVLQEHQGSRLLATALTNLGKLLSDQGRSGEALPLLERALQVRDAGGDTASTGRMLNLAHLGVEYLRVGDLRRGRQALQAATALGDELGGREGRRALIRSRLCALDLAEDQLQEAAGCSVQALALADAAVAAARSADDALRIRALVRLVQAQVAVELEDLILARQAFTEARDFFAGREPQPAGIAVNGLGWLALEAGDAAAARDRFRDALALHRAAGDRRALASSLLGTARAERALGDPEAALAAVEGSLRVVEEMRSEPTGRTLRARFLASRHAHYDLHVELLMSLAEAHPDDAWADRAFLACEHARARSLLDTLNDLGTAADPAGEAEEKRLEGRLDELERQRSDLVWEGADADRLAAIDAEMERKELALQRLRSPAAAAPSFTFEPADAADLRRRVVDEDSLLLSFHLGAERSFVWVTDRRGSEFHVLPPRDEIEAVARRAHELLARGLRTEQGPAERELRRLGEMLLAPVASRLGGVQRLLVAAEGALLYTPFAALPVPETGRLLVADHEIVTVPSATTLAAQRRRLAGRPAAAGVVAVMADPVFGPEDPRLTGVPSGVHPPGRRSGEDFRRLPYSAGEAAAILAVAPPGARFVATGFAADLESVRAHRLDGFRVVHFATHARVSAQHPERSGIILSRFDAAGRPRPGDLRSQEIYSLHLPAELVVLSACSTALGEELRGEGLVGFTQGFLAAGAARVMVSLWAVDDRSTAQLMERFYRALYTQGLSPAAALRSAQLALLREGDRSPYHWAGFVLQGEPG